MAFPWSPTRSRRCGDSSLPVLLLRSRGGAACLPPLDAPLGLAPVIPQLARLAQLFQLAARHRVALVFLAADRSIRNGFRRPYETLWTGNLVRASLRPLASSGEAGSAWAQLASLRTHIGFRSASTTLHSPRHLGR